MLPLCSNNLSTRSGGNVASVAFTLPHGSATRRAWEAGHRRPRRRPRWGNTPDRRHPFSRLSECVRRARSCPDFADQAHFVVHDLPQRRLRLEPVAQAVVVEKPAAVNQPLDGLVHQGWIVVGLEHGQTQVGRIDAALAVCTMLCRNAASRLAGRRAAGRTQSTPGRFLGVGQRAFFRAGDIRLDHLLVLRSVETAGQVVGQLLVARLR